MYLRAKVCHSGSYNGRTEACCQLWAILMLNSACTTVVARQIALSYSNQPFYWHFTTRKRIYTPSPGIGRALQSVTAKSWGCIGLPRQRTTDHQSMAGSAASGDVSGGAVSSEIAG
jgi:hypothetical protein